MIQTKLTPSYPDSGNAGTVETGHAPSLQRDRAEISKHAHPIRGYFYIAAATLCWGLGAAAARAVFTGQFLPAPKTQITPLVLSQTRVSISFLLLAVILFASQLARSRRDRVGVGASNALSGLPRRALLYAAIIGTAGISASNFFYYLAIERTNVTTAIVLQYMAPLWVLLYVVARGRQRITVLLVSGVVLAVLGSALAVGALNSAALAFDTLGVAAAIAASVSFAFYNVGASGLLQNYSRWPVLAAALGGATVFWAVVNPPWRLVQAQYSAPQWGFLLAFALGSILLPYSFYFSGLRHLDATRAIVTSCLEPVFAIALAVLLAGEHVSALQIVGIALVLAATIMVQTR